MMYSLMSPKGYEITFNGYNKGDLKKVVQFLKNHDIKSFKILVWISTNCTKGARNSIVKYVPYNTMCIKKFKKYKPKSCIEFKVDKLNFVYLYFKIN